MKKFKLLNVLLLVFLSAARALAAEEGDYTYTVDSGKAIVTAFTATGTVANIPDTLGGCPVTAIGNNAFASRLSLETVSISDGVTEIGLFAFDGCTNLQSVTFGSGLIKINKAAFRNCSRLTSLTLPDSLEELGTAYYTEGIFYNCAALESVIFGSGLRKVGNAAFYGCSKLGEVILPDTLTAIGDEAFSGCALLQAADLGGGLLSLGGGAFYGCAAMTNMALPETLGIIGGSAFANCSALRSLTIPDGVTNFNWSAISGCTGLRSVFLGDGISTFVDYAMANHPHLERVTIGNGVTSISAYAFSGCTNLLSVTFGTGLKTIQYGAFKNCSRLASVTFPDSLEELGDAGYWSNGVFYNCTSLTSVTFGSGLQKVGQYTFNMCTNLTELALPDSVVTISAHAFESCMSLRSIHLGANVQTLGDYAFWHCSALTQIVMPETLLSIGAYVFQQCNALTGVYFKGNAPTVSSSTFSEAPNVTVYRLLGTTGWGATLAGRTVSVWSAAAPVFTPPDGTLITNSLQVVITCATEDAEIYYTLDETDPTTNSLFYSVPLVLNDTATVKAKAVRTDMQDSPAATAHYYLWDTTPAFDPPDGRVFTNTLDVTISSAAEGVTLRYTTDGSDVTAASAVYFTPIRLSARATVKARAFVGETAVSEQVQAAYTLQAAAAAVFSPADGTVFTNSLTVSLECEETGASIRYTLDGTDPSETSILYTNAFQVVCTKQVKARAYAPGFTPSATASATYTQTLEGSLDNTNLTFVTGGAAWYSQDAETYDGVDAARSGVIGNGQDSWVSTEVTGPGDLMFRWKVQSELMQDFLKFYTNQSVVAQISGHTSWQTLAMTVASGAQTLKWEYHKDISAASGQDCGWLDEVRWYPYSLSLPTFEPVDGTGFEGTLDVTLACAAESAAVHYTTDGSEPTESSPLYSAPLSITETTTIRAKAFTDDARSAVASATYTRLVPAATPTFDPADGVTFETSLQVALACATEGAEIRYTLDGAEPATNSALYASALTLTETTTVKARAFKDGMAGSAVASATYTKLTRLIRIAPETLGFGSLQVGQSATNTMLIHNDGNTNLTVSAIACPAGFAAAPTAFTVNSASSVTVTVVFTPAEAGVYNVNLTVTSDATGGAGVMAVSGTGTTPEPRLWHVDAAMPDDEGDGLSWGTAKQTIQAAVDAAADGDTVMVTNGVYWQFSVNNAAITIRSVNGADVTVIDADSDDRCALLGDPENENVQTNTVLEGFTLQNGDIHYYGDGGGAWGGTLRGCVLQNNCGDYGGGAFGSALYGCTLEYNYADYSGGGASGCFLEACRMTGNVSEDYGGGAEDSELHSCVITGNESYLEGGGTCECALTGCTVVGNMSDDGGGVSGGTAVNSIIWDNEVYSGSATNYDSTAVISYSCSLPLPDGTGNIDGAPVFLNVADNDYRLREGSAGVDAGNSDLTVCEFDFIGNARVQGNAVDMGACEGAVSGYLVRVHVTGHGSVTPAGAQVVPVDGSLTVEVTEGPGPFLHYLTNGVLASTETVFTWQGVDADGEVTAVFGPAVFYVDADMPDDSADGNTWATAKQSIQTAIDAAWSGDAIWVTNGVYAAIDTQGKQLAIRSVNGASETVIDGEMLARCANLGNGTPEGRTALTGFTLRNGYSDRGGGGVMYGILTDCALHDNSAESNGGGANQAVLTGCVIAENTSGGRGGGVYGCAMTNCVIRSNYAALSGGGTYLGECSDCVITNNLAENSGGGACQGTFYGCRIEDNQCVSESGGGAYGGTFFDCVISGNESIGYRGGGVCYGTLTRCVVSDNTAIEGGGTYGGTLSDCLVIRNRAGDGGGTRNGTLKNVTVTGNIVDLCGGGVSGGTQVNCIIWGNWVYDTIEEQLFIANYDAETTYSMTYTCTTPARNGAGNIAVDPLFVNAAGGDYSLATGSPCLNAGNSAAVESTMDLAGNTRIQGAAVDMGAYERAEEATVSTPTFGPADGTTFETMLAVSLACATEGAEIRYTLDGSTPTTNSALYATALTLTETTTVKVRAFKSGLAGSAVASATYTKVVAGDVFRLLGAVYYGDASDQQGAGVTVVDENVYAVGKTSANGWDGLVVCYPAALTNGAAPRWGFGWPSAAGYDTFDSICATTNALFIGGQSVSATFDGSGGKEPKGVVLRFPANGSGKAVWTNQVGGLSYQGWEMVCGVAFDSEKSPTNIYSWGFAQKTSSSKLLILSKRNATTGTAVWTVNDETANGLFAERYGRSLCVLNGAVYGVGDGWNGSVNQAVIEKFNAATGVRVWERYSTASQNRAYYGVAKGESAVYAVGVNGAVGVNADFLIEKWSEGGTLLWSKTIDCGSPNDVLRAVAVGGGRVFAVGSTKADTAGGTDLIVLALDTESGSEVASTLYGGTADEYGYGVSLAGNDLYVTGSTKSYGGGGDDLLLLRYAIPTLGTVETPVFEPGSGAWFDESLSVTVTCATAGAEIRYTVDGGEPNSGSALYTGPFTLTQTATVKARAFLAGMSDSGIATALFTQRMQVGMPEFSPAGGMSFTNGLEVTITSPTEGAAIRFTLDGSEPTAASTLYTNALAICESVAIKARAFADGMRDSVVAEAGYHKLPRVGPPVFTPATGTEFTNEVSIALTCATNGAAIYYTLDGSEPTRDGTLYAGAITLTQTTIVKAKAFKEGFADSDTAEANYTRAFTLADAVDAPALVFTTGGEQPWFIETTVTHSGGAYAAQSGGINHRQVSWIETTVTGAGTLRFWWKVSCEDDELDDWDYVGVAVDGAEVQRIDGEAAWRQVTLTVTAGVHTVRWTYAKDRVVSEGQDCAWLDEVVWTPAAQATQTTPVPVPFGWLNTFALATGGDYEAAAFADSDGDGRAAWQEYVAGTCPTNVASRFLAWLTLSNGVPHLFWTPDLGEARRYTVEGKASLRDAEWVAPTNADSRFFRVKVDMP